MSKNRLRDFKKDVDLESSRQKRHDVSVTLRRDKVEEELKVRRQQSEGATDLPKDWLDKLQESDAILRYRMHHDKMEELCEALAKIGPTTAPDLDMDEARQIAISEIVDQMERLLRGEYTTVGIFLPRAVKLVIPCLAIPRPHPRLLVSAMSIVNVISGGHRYQEKHYLSAGHVPTLMTRWIVLEDDVIRPLAFETLANMCLDSAECRAEVLSHDIFPMAHKAVLQQASLDVAAAAANFVACTITMHPPPDVGICQKALAILLPLLGCEETDLITCCMWGVRAMFKCGLEGHLALAHAAVSPQQMVAIFNLLKVQPANATRDQAHALRCVALTTVGAAVSQSDAYTAALTAAGMLPQLALVIRHGSSNEREHALLLLANLTCTDAAPGAAVTLMDQAGIFGAVKSMGPVCVYTLTKNRALFLSMAAHSATKEQLMMLIDCDLVYYMAEAMDIPDTDLIATMMQDFRRVVERVNEGLPIGSENIAVTKAHEHDMELVLRVIATQCRNKACVRLAEGLLASYFPDAHEDPMPDDAPVDEQAAKDALKKEEQDFFTMLNKHITQQLGGNEMKE